MNWCYKARVIKILAYNKLDLNIDLGFNLSYRVQVELLFEINEEDEEKAKNCLVCILGGQKRIVIMVMKDNKGRYSVEPYLSYFVPIEGISEVVGDRKLPSVRKLMEYANSIEFDANVLYLKLGRGE